MNLWKEIREALNGPDKPEPTADDIERQNREAQQKWAKWSANERKASEAQQNAQQRRDEARD